MVRDDSPRLLRVDCSTGTVTSERIPTAWLEADVGGKGLGARYLYEELEMGTEPLGPDNALFSCSGHSPG